MSGTTLAYIEQRTELCAGLRQMIVDRLDLGVEPDWITDDQPLFGRGLELDSVDALELVSAIEYELDVAISDDDPAVFGSINALANYIEAHREE